jgi:hypothetical protein
MRRCDFQSSGINLSRLIHHRAGYWQSAVGGRLLGSVPKPRSETTCRLFFRVNLLTETLDQIFGLLPCSTISSSRILLMPGVFAQSNCGRDDVPPSPVIS